MLIDVKNLFKIYHEGEESEVRALDGVSLSVDRGEFLAIIGQSGSGKSTLMNILGCLDIPTYGDYHLDGVDVTELSDRQLAHIRNKQIGFIFQGFNLIPALNAWENVELPLIYQGVPASKRADRVEAALERVGLAERAGHKPTEMSGGQQQRVAIARAVVNKPLVLLLDEPFSALDYKLRRAMQLEIKRLQRRLGITFVFVTHDQEEAFAMSDRVVVMNQGRIEQIGTPQEIYEEPSNLYVARFVGEINILPARIMSVPGEGIYIADISGRRFTLRTSRPFAAGDRVNVLLRPEDIRVYAHDDERPEGPYLTGRIEETVYKGATVDISIALDSGETLSVAEFFNEDDAEISYNRGERVAVTWVDGWEVVLPYEAD